MSPKSAWASGKLHHVEVFPVAEAGKVALYNWDRAIYAPKLFTRVVKAGRAECTVWMLVVRLK